MRPRVKTIDQQFGDGHLMVLKTQDISGPGEYENIAAVPFYKFLHYQKRTVGYGRFLQGKQVDLRISKLLRIQRLPGIEIYDLIQTEDGRQFRIEQIQEISDVYPASLDLSLSLVEQRLEVVDYD